MSLVPELHDIGKLLDTRATNIKHNLENCPIQHHTSTWRGIIEHHCSPIHEKDPFEKYPTSSDTFRLHIADGLAAATSRYKVRGETGSSYHVHKLWNPRIGITFPLLKTQEDVKRLVSYVAGDPSAQDYFIKYGYLLRNRAEDATSGRNITSLYTHSKLTGQFFKILVLDETSFPLREDLGSLSREEVAELTTRKENEWKMSVMRCKIGFALEPVRARDLNVFKAQESFINEVKAVFPHNILFHTSDELLLISSNAQQLLNNLKAKIEQLGFSLEIIRGEAQIAGLKPDPEDMVGNKKETIYPVLPREIEPPICELCQLNKANPEPWIDEDSGISEYICSKCWKIREMGSILRKLVEWETLETNPKICWVKLWLDYEKLVCSLTELYVEYLKGVGVTDPRKQAEIRFSTISEFQWDYDGFLADFWKTIESQIGQDNVQRILLDFSGIKVESLNEIKTVLKIYNELFTRFFPKLKRAVCPIKLSVVCSNIKFPFLENWRLLRDSKSDVNVHIVGKGKMDLSIQDISNILDIEVKSKASLHRLIELNKKSTRLSKIVLYDRMDKDYKRNTEIREAVERFGFQNVLTYAEILSD